MNAGNLRQDFAARFGWADYPKTEAEMKAAIEDIVATKVTELRSWAERAKTRKGGLSEEIVGDLVTAVLVQMDFN